MEGEDPGKVGVKIRKGSFALEYLEIESESETLRVPFKEITHLFAGRVLSESISVSPGSPQTKVLGSVAGGFPKWGVPGAISVAGKSARGQIRHESYKGAQIMKLYILFLRVNDQKIYFIDHENIHYKGFLHEEFTCQSITNFRALAKKMSLLFTMSLIDNSVTDYLEKGINFLPTYPNFFEFKKKCLQSAG